MFKKIRRFFIYKKILKNNKEFLKEKHDLNIDWIWRMYKTYIIPPYEIDAIKDYGVSYVNQLIQKEVHKIDETFMKLHLSEYVGFMEAVPLNDREIGLAFRFKYIDFAKLIRNIIWILLFIILGVIGFFTYSYIGIIGGTTIWLIFLIISKLIK